MNYSSDMPTVPVGIVQESLVVKDIKKAWDIMKELFRRSLYIDLKFVEIYISDLVGHKLADEELPNGIDMLFYPIDYSLLLSPTVNVSRITRPLLPTANVILTSAPKSITNASLEFLSMDLMCLASTLISLFAVSLVMTMTSFLNFDNKRKQKMSMQIFYRDFFDLLGKNSFVFFFEPFEKTPFYFHWRFAYLSWLLCTLVLNFEMSCSLKSQFSETKYRLFDTVRDLVIHEERTKAIKNGPSLRFIKDMALSDWYYKMMDDQLQNEGNLIDVSELVFGDVLNEIPRSEISLIISEIICRSVLIEKFNDEDGESVSNFAGKYRVSPLLEHSNGYSVFITSTKMASNQLFKRFNRVFSANMEQQLSYSVRMKMLYVIDRVSWIEPEQVDIQLTFEGFRSLLFLYLFGNAIAITVFVLAILYYFFSKRFKKPRKLSPIQRVAEIQYQNKNRRQRY